MVSTWINYGRLPTTSRFLRTQCFHTLVLFFFSSLLSILLIFSKLLMQRHFARLLFLVLSLNGRVQLECRSFIFYLESTTCFGVLSPSLSSSQRGWTSWRQVYRSHSTLPILHIHQQLQGVHRFSTLCQHGYGRLSRARVGLNCFLQRTAWIGFWWCWLMQLFRLYV